MGISSLGAGSSILTQDVIDQLKAADEAKFVTPIDTKLKAESDKSAAFDVVNALMDNVYESVKRLNEYGVFEARTASSSNVSVAEVSALESSDIQDFSLEVSTLATKEIVQSGSFGAKTDSIATGSGKMELMVGSQTFSFNYDATTTLENLKDMINKDAKESVNATIVQVATGDYRLLLSAAKTGTGQAISISDVVGEGETLNTALKPDPDLVADPDNLVDGMTNVQTAVDAAFTFNGVDVVRSSNTVSDLLSGVTITLKGAGTSDISVKQDRENITEAITNFVDKYNSAIYQLEIDTKSSQEESERGIFSSDSTMKGMKSALSNMLASIGEGAGKIQDYGLEIDADGRLSLDNTKLTEMLDKDATSTQAFFVGGTFTDANGQTRELRGVFTDIETEVAKYSKYNNVLDQFKESIDTRTESLNTQREKAVARLESSYAIMTKRFAAYDLIINQFNTASDMFTQMINTEIAANS